MTSKKEEIKLKEIIGVESSKQNPNKNNSRRTTLKAKGPTQYLDSLRLSCK